MHEYILSWFRHIQRCPLDDVVKGYTTKLSLLERDEVDQEEYGWQW